MTKSPFLFPEDTMSYFQYIAEVMRVKDGNPDWRMGQTYFNVLRQYRPDLSEQVRATKLDPFHIDSRIDAFLEFVSENW
jgi:hypothetical protein